MRYFSICFILIFIQLKFVSAQTSKYFIEFTDKNSSPYSISRPSEFLSDRSINRRAKQNIQTSYQDLPVNKTYTDSLKKMGVNVWYTSRWMNSALIETDILTLEKVKNLSFIKHDNTKSFDKVSAKRSNNKSKITSVKSINQSGKLKTKETLTSADYGWSYNQAKMIGVDEMHNQGFMGNGMRVAIFDAGFKNANQIKCFQHLFNNNKVLATYDFVKKEIAVYEDDSHGLNVFSVMAAYQPGSLIGPAYQADYILLRTEDASSEYKVEEVNWLMAAEYADSAGVDVINSSLGYSTFDNPKMNYKTGQLDGKTAIITRAADIAATKGMLIVSSAGNEGNNSWGLITAPADADSILTVGAVDENQNYATFSSTGPTSDGRIKPDLCTQGINTVLCSPSGIIITSSGTSFSSPLMAGMATGFWQAHPELNNMQVIQYLRRSGNNFNTPNNMLGYGIPNFKKADQLVKVDQLLEKDKYLVAPNPFDDNSVTIYLNKLFTNETANIQITDASGKVIYSKNNLKLYSENQIIFPSRITSGVYILKFVSPSLQFSEKIVKQ